MNTTTETVVPSPDVVKEAPAAQLPAAPPAIDTPGPTANFTEVVGAIAAVMADLTPVGKGGTNTFHNYKYARMQDILQMLTPLMGKHGLVIFQYEAERNMFDENKVIAITYRFVVAHKSGQTWINPVPQTGMSPCRTSKNTFDDKAFAKCHTSARKYFLLSLFQVPTEDENDPDNEKRQRSAAPVPSPDGSMSPHYLDPEPRETFERWGARYWSLVSKSKTLDEANAWDSHNDDLLAQMSNNDKATSAYDKLMADFGDLKERLKRAAAPDLRQEVHKPETPDFYDKAQSGVAAPGSASTTANTEPTAGGPGASGSARPEGVPDPDKDPEGFVKWGSDRLRAVAERKDAKELELIWTEEVMAWADGLFKPDVDVLKGVYDELMEKIGG